MYQRALGRHCVSVNPTAPHLSLMSDAKLPPLAIEVDRTALITQPWGMMLNGYDDSDPQAPILNDCTIAALFHGKQIADAMAGKRPIVDANPYVLQAFEDMGYNPANPATNTGLMIQDVLNYSQSVGIPVSATEREKSAAWCKIDHTNEDHIKHIIDTCGYAYIGAAIPSLLMQEEIPFFHAAKGADIAGGHAFIVWGYKPNGLYRVVSWGMGDIYMTPEFLNEYVDEAYAVVDPDLVNETGQTPGGLTLAQLVSYVGLYKTE